MITIATIAFFATSYNANAAITIYGEATSVETDGSSTVINCDAGLSICAVITRSSTQNVYLVEPANSTPIYAIRYAVIPTKDGSKIVVERKQ